jgi:hypothetical protein
MASRSEHWLKNTAVDYTSRCIVTEFGLAYFTHDGKLLTSSGGLPNIELARTEARNAFASNIEPRAVVIKIFQGRDATEENFVEEVTRATRRV